MEPSAATKLSLKFEIVDREMARILATKTEAERLEIAWGLWRSAREMIRNLISAQSPELTAAEVERQVAKRMSHAG